MESTRITRSDAADVYEAARRAFTEAGVRMVREHPESLRLEGRTGWTWHAFGQLIEAEVCRIDDHLSSVSVVTTPRWPLQVIDWGEAKRLRRTLLGSIFSELGRQRK